MISNELKYYFQENASPEVSPGTLWEAHKAFIRGKFIELGARKKRERATQQLELIRDISALERQHKVGLSQSVLMALTKKREDLKNLFHAQQKQQFRIIAQRTYAWGNKSGRLLACSLQQKKAATFIAKIKSKTDELVHYTPAIAVEFRSFYQHLYHVHQHIPDQESRKQFIQDYLIQANLPKLPEDALATLDGEFTTEELRRALRPWSRART